MEQTTVAPYLAFNGNAREAMTFYQSVLGGELSVQTFADAGMSETPESADLVMHAALKSNAISFFASDAPPGKPVTFGNNISMCLMGSDEEKLADCFAKLAEDGMVTMPLEKQFWGDTFGMCADRFGINWMVNISAAK